MVIYIWKALRKCGKRDEKRFDFGIISFFTSSHSYNAAHALIDSSLVENENVLN